MNKPKEEKALSNNAYEAFVEASKKFKKPSFNKRVKYQGRDYSYADLAEVYSCVKQPLLEAGLLIKHDIIYKEDKPLLSTYLQYKDGSKIGEVTFPISLQGQTMQQIGGQITYIKRYSLGALLSIAAEEDDDAQGLQNEKMHKQPSSEELLKKKKELINLAESYLIELPVDRVAAFEEHLRRVYKINHISQLDLAAIKKELLNLEAEKKKQSKKGV